MHEKKTVLFFFTLVNDIPFQFPKCKNNMNGNIAFVTKFTVKIGNDFNIYPSSVSMNDMHNIASVN